MQKAAYRIFRTETEFTIDCFHHCPPTSLTSSPAPNVKIAIDLKLRCYDNIQNMGAQDLAQIAKVFVCCKGKERWRGFIGVSSWSLMDRLWERVGKSQTRELYLCQLMLIPVGKMAELCDVGFSCLSVTRASQRHVPLITRRLCIEHVAQAKPIAGKQGLGREELMFPIRWACYDDVRD